MNRRSSTSLALALLGLVGCGTSTPTVLVHPAEAEAAWVAEGFPDKARVAALVDQMIGRASD